MEELTVAKEKLVEMFESGRIVDSGRGWIMDNLEVEIIALHEVDPKFLQDVTNAKLYKIKIKGNR
jgi:hypothetical protein